MKILLTAILFAFPLATLADGVVLFDKATGTLQEKYVTQVVTNQEDGIVSTNTLCAFAKIQPKETTYQQNRILGAQVLKKVDWTLYDLASFTGTAPANPTHTNDLPNVVAWGVQERLAIETGNMDYEFDSKLKAIVTGIVKAYNAKLPAQYRPTATEVKEAINAELKK